MGAMVGYLEPPFVGELYTSLPPGEESRAVSLESRGKGKFLPSVPRVGL
jgi:hypothetical protein